MQINFNHFLKVKKHPLMNLLFTFRDAWSLGAIDPTSGTAVLLEITQVLGQMYKNGTSLCSHLSNIKVHLCFR
jgi:hypothetical protein